jgi:hypothetical protein
MARRTGKRGHSMLCPTKNFCGELSADINADSITKIRYKIKGKGRARIACLHSFGKYAFAFAREGSEGAEVAKKKEKG